MRFEPGNPYGKLGRPRGSRNRLARVVFEDLLESWTEAVKEGSTLTKGKAALLALFRESPREYAKLYLSVMPKEFVFEKVVSELDDAELAEIIKELRARLADPALPSAVKMIEQSENAH
jgi:hypothetical protein